MLLISAVQFHPYDVCSGALGTTGLIHDGYTLCGDDKKGCVGSRRVA